jgi:hypothetical protein
MELMKGPLDGGIVMGQEGQFASLVRLFQVVMDHERRIAALEAENAGLRARLGPLVSEGRVQATPLPPLGPGLLGFLKQRGHPVHVTVSATGAGNPECLFTEDNSEWYSPNTQGSWVQWTIGGGLKAVISCVKIRGRTEKENSDLYGVKNFRIEGSNDAAGWTPIIESETCPTTLENWITRGQTVDQAQRGFSMIRLTQTGPAVRNLGGAYHLLVLTYVDFGGKIIFPATAE